MTPKFKPGMLLRQRHIANSTITIIVDNGYADDEPRKAMMVVAIIGDEVVNRLDYRLLVGDKLISVNVSYVDKYLEQYGTEI